jgi:hypothetical protein
MAKQRFESGSQVGAAQRLLAGRYRTSKILALAAVVGGGVLLLYGVPTWSRKEKGRRWAAKCRRLGMLKRFSKSNGIQGDEASADSP